MPRSTDATPHGEAEAGPGPDAPHGNWPRHPHRVKRTEPAGGERNGRRVGPDAASRGGGDDPQQSTARSSAHAGLRESGQHPHSGARTFPCQLHSELCESHVYFAIDPNGTCATPRTGTERLWVDGTERAAPTQAAGPESTSPLCGRRCGNGPGVRSAERIRCAPCSHSGRIKTGRPP